MITYLALPLEIIIHKIFFFNSILNQVYFIRQLTTFLPTRQILW